jgi:hypothetical protein
MTFYRTGSNPLKPLAEDKIKAGEIVYNELGKCVKKIYIEDSVYFVEILDSVLMEGETMSNLTPVQLGLFWTLSKNKFKKYENKS